MTFRMVFVAAVALTVCAPLTGCGKYGLKGDRGLPPPPENMAYPSVNEGPRGGAIRPLKSPAEQERIRSELAAKKRQR